MNTGKDKQFMTILALLNTLLPQYEISKMIYRNCHDEQVVELQNKFDQTKSYIPLSNVRQHESLINNLSSPEAFELGYDCGLQDQRRDYDFMRQSKRASTTTPKKE